MTEQELKHLKRTDLLEMLLAQSREMDQLRERLEQAEKQLADRQILLNEAGSIAEASLRVHQVFEAAQAASDQYLENIQALSDRQQSICTRLEEESRQKAQQLLMDTQTKCRDMEIETEAKCQAMQAETEARCSRMTQEAEQKAQASWEETRQKLEQFIEQQAGLREILSVVSRESKHS